MAADSASRNLSFGETCPHDVETEMMTMTMRVAPQLCSWQGFGRDIGDSECDIYARSSYVLTVISFRLLLDNEMGHDLLC